VLTINGKDTYECQKVNEEDEDDDESPFVHILAPRKYNKSSQKRTWSIN